MERKMRYDKNQNFSTNIFIVTLLDNPPLARIMLVEICLYLHAQTNFQHPQIIVTIPELRLIQRKVFLELRTEKKKNLS